MGIGNPAAWADRFRSFDNRFLQRVVAVWPRCLAVLPPLPDEDNPDGTAYSKGRIDVAVFLNQDRDTYLAYECKRLNEVRGDGRRSLARGYVMDGLSRFVAGQYSEGLPVGCMLGYVLDGDLAYATSSVRAKIVECGQDVALVAEPRDDVAVGEATRFFSRHRRGSNGGEIEIRHALLPFR